MAVDKPDGPSMDDVWAAKKIVDSTIHPGMLTFDNIPERGREAQTAGKRDEDDGTDDS